MKLKKKRRAAIERAILSRFDGHAKRVEMDLIGAYASWKHPDEVMLHITIYFDHDVLEIDLDEFWDVHDRVIDAMGDKLEGIFPFMLPRRIEETDHA